MANVLLLRVEETANDGTKLAGVRRIQCNDKPVVGVPFQLNDKQKYCIEEIRQQRDIVGRPYFACEIVPHESRWRKDKTIDLAVDMVESGWALCESKDEEHLTDRFFLGLIRELLPLLV